MQEPRKDLFDKKFHRDFSGCTLSGMSDTGRYTRAKRKGIPSGIPSQVIMKKEKMLSLYLLSGLIISQDV